MVALVSAGVLALSIAVPLALLAWAPTVRGNDSPPPFPSPPYIAAVRPGPGAVRSIPGPVRVALLGLRAESAIDVRPGGGLVITGPLPETASDLMRLVYQQIGPNSSAATVARAPDVVAAVEEMYRWSERHRLVVPSWRFRVAHLAVGWSWPFAIVSAIAFGMWSVQVPAGRTVEGWLPGAVWYLLVALLITHGNLERRLWRTNLGTATRRAATDRLREQHAALRPVSPSHHYHQRPLDDPRFVPPETVTGLWWIPAGWGGYRPGEAELAAAVFGVEWECDPWFSHLAGIYAFERDDGSNIRKVAHGGPDGEPGWPDGCFGVIDIPKYVEDDDDIGE